VDIFIYICFVLLFIVLWKHFTKKFLSEEGLKWHAYMVSTNLSIFVSISFLIIAFEVKSWLLDESTEQEKAIEKLSQSVTPAMCRDIKGKSIQSLYASLQSFKEEPAYLQQGFVSEPYSSWYQQVRCIQLLKPNSEVELIAHTMMILAMEYRTALGKKDELIIKKEKEIQQFIEANPQSSQNVRRRKL